MTGIETEKQAMTKTAWVIINANAGTSLNEDLETLVHQMTKILQDTGWHIRSKIIHPDDLGKTFQVAIEDANAETLFIGGGDGTVKAAAELSAQNNKPLGIIPLGTLNRMARDLNLPLDPVEAITTLSTGKLAQIDCAYANDELFLCNCLLGLPPRIARGRQNLRNKSLRERLIGYTTLLSRIAAARQKMTFTIDDAKHTKRKVRALSVIVTNNIYDNEPNLFLKRSALNTGRLSIYLSQHRNGWGLFIAYVRACLGLWRGDEALDHTTAKTVEIDSPKNHLLTSLDGEVKRLSSPAKFRIQPKFLTVIVPKDDQ